MDLLGMLQVGASFFFLGGIVSAVFGSVKEGITKQQILQGKLVFLIYSLLVYYSGFRIGILFFDFFINEPIIQAYNLINYFTTNFLNVDISTSPAFLFKYLLPAIFIYYFAEYWLKYAVFDPRISKMVALAAVVILFKSNVSIGFINLFTFGGRLDRNLPAMMFDLTSNFFSSARELVGGLLSLEEGVFGTASIMFLVTIVIVIFVAVFIVFIVGKEVMSSVYPFLFKLLGGDLSDDERKAAKKRASEILVAVFLFIVLFGFLSGPILMFFVLPENTPLLLRVSLYTPAFLSFVSVLSIIGDAFMLVAMALFGRMMKSSVGGGGGSKKLGSSQEAEESLEEAVQQEVDAEIRKEMGI